jgi:hypothetical protein
MLRDAARLRELSQLKTRENRLKARIAESHADAL